MAFTSSPVMTRTIKPGIYLPGFGVRTAIDVTPSGAVEAAGGLGKKSLAFGSYVDQLAELSLDLISFHQIRKSCSGQHTPECGQR